MSRMYVLPKGRLRRSDIDKINRVSAGCKVIDARILNLAFGSLMSENSVDDVRAAAASLHEDVDALMDVVTKRGEVVEAKA